MVRADQQGGPTPIGSKVATITPNIALALLVKDSMSRGATEAGSYTTSVQLRFEPWKCGDRGRSLVGAGSARWADVAGRSTQPGDTAQQWKTTPHGALLNSATGLCLDAKDAGAANATPLIAWQCNDASNQAWATR